MLMCRLIFIRDIFHFNHLSQLCINTLSKSLDPFLRKLCEPGSMKLVAVNFYTEEQKKH